jgi:hypothetical protein
MPGHGAHHPRREPLHDEPVERGLIDPAEQRDERLDFTVGSAAQVEPVREPHDRTHADVVLLDVRYLELLDFLIGMHDDNALVVVEPELPPLRDADLRRLDAQRVLGPVVPRRVLVQRDHLRRVEPADHRHLLAGEDLPGSTVV